MLEDIAILAVLIILASFLSAAKESVNLFTGSKLRLREEGEGRNAQFISRVLENAHHFRITLQAGYAFVITFAGIYAGAILKPYYINYLLKYGINEDQVTTWILVLGGFVLALVMTVFSYFFGKLLPSVVINKRSAGLSDLYLSIAYWISRLFYPLAMLLLFMANKVTDLAGVKPQESTKKIIEEEILNMVDEGGERGSLDEDEIEMINNVFEFNDKTAEEVATHRTNIKAIDISDPIEEILETLANGSHSRWPVYEESIDNVIGILYVRDMLRNIVLSGNLAPVGENIDIRNILREPYFVPTAKKADELFSQMQEDKVHLSIVIDEYGGTAGLVTMEDLVEEIMGNIFDEYDEDELPAIEEIEADKYMVNGSVGLDELGKTLDIDLPEEEFDTASGFMIGQLKRIPDATETPEIHYSGYNFRVVQIQDKRISRLIAEKVEL